ncbi:MAG TPA: Rho termination factor N-terminal domain-containing protein [Solirubrobacteraceae bacterium]|nr:Rho termination factor N-terminal domain-containing protein [Solirubrobacteraceae bacterium]
MSSVLDRSALAESPLADLHLLANELGVDGFRRLRKTDLIDAIVAKQAGDDLARPALAAETETDGEGAERPRRGRRGGRSRARSRDADADADAERSERSERAERGGRRERAEKPEAEDRVVQGVIELLGNGSAFVRLSPPGPTDEDVYVSAAQVKRCELVSGDRVGGPMRPPRRSERFPSLVRIDTINDRPAEEVAEGTRFEDLPVTFPTERLALGTEDATVKAIEWLTPFGKGSRVVVTGPARAGKSEALRRIVAALIGQEDLELSVVLAGVRPEEIADWRALPVVPSASVTFAASPETQAQAVEHAVEQGRRVAARGAHAVVVIDSLELVPASSARRALAAARNITDGGSLTILASAPVPVGGETTVIALDATLTAMRRFPALDLAASGTMRPELLVGNAGADAIATARAETL